MSAPIEPEPQPTQDQAPPFENLEAVLESIGHSLLMKGMEHPARLVSEADIRLVKTGFDNWDGGTDVWELQIRVPFPEYHAFEEAEVKDLESLMQKVVDSFLPKTGHWVHPQLRPAAEVHDPNWRKTIAHAAGMSTTNQRSAHGETAKNQGKSMPSIFLSHNSKDKFFVRELAARLSVHGVKAWIDEAEINIGDSLTEKIGRAIKANDFVGVVLSTNSIGSEWVKRELQIAIQREFAEKRVVVLPILIERVDLPPFLSDKLYADFTSPDKFNGALSRLLSALGIAATPEPMLAPETRPRIQIPSSSPRSDQDLAKFEDISIVDLDTARSHRPDPTNGLYNMYLRLSSVPPSDWAAIFEAERHFPRHSMWRRAWIESGNVVIHCVPGELEQYHLADLRQDATSTNRKYREYLLEEARKSAMNAGAAKQEQEQLVALRKKLGF